MLALLQLAKKNSKPINRIGRVAILEKNYALAGLSEYPVLRSQPFRRENKGICFPQHREEKDNTGLINLQFF